MMLIPLKWHFKMAGIFAFKDAMKNANPILLEPIMKVEVSTPEEYQGELMGDLNRRRGQIQGMELAEMLALYKHLYPLKTCLVILLICDPFLQAEQIIL